jgi:hypothetical protein
MEKEFVPYELALRMKQLGFNEPCFGYYFNHSEENFKEGKFDYRGELNIEYSIYKENTYYILAPTFSQAFRFFRENHNLHAEPYTVDMGAIEYCFQIRDLYSEKYIYDNFVGAGGSYHGTFDTPEEAELKCLEKLIDIVGIQNLRMEQHNKFCSEITSDGVEFLKSKGFIFKPTETTYPFYKSEHEHITLDIHASGKYRLCVTTKYGVNGENVNTTFIANEEGETLKEFINKHIK